MALLEARPEGAGTAAAPRPWALAAELVDVLLPGEAAKGVGPPRGSFTPFWLCSIPTNVVRQLELTDGQRSKS